MAHQVKYNFGTQILSDELYKMYWPKWQSFYTIHLLINHRYYLDKESPINEFDEKNIQNYNQTFGFMVRDIMQRANLVFD